MVDREPFPTSTSQPVRRSARVVVDGYGRLLRFGLAGILATGLYFAIVNAIIMGFGRDPVEASVYAYLLSLGFSYLMQSRFTFRVRSDNLGQVTRFAVISLTGLVISIWAMAFVVNAMELPSLIGAGAVSILIPLTNYFVFQHWVFAQRRGGEDTAPSTDRS